MSVVTYKAPEQIFTDKGVMFESFARKNHDVANDRIFSTSGEFTDSWKPADYIVDGILQRGYCYSFTSPTGHGKTAVALYLTASIGTGTSFAGCETVRGRVGYFAAENPNDVQARWIAMQDHMRFNGKSADVWFCQITVDLQSSFEKIAAEAEAIGGFDLIIVDTSQAFFLGDEENSNAQMVAHAKAMRRLTKLPGGPCVVILTHPVKNPTRDNLIPRGGGGFLAEVDGNLTAWKDNDVLVLHHQGKLRGPGFAPISFQLKPVTSNRLKDSKSRLLPTVVAQFISDDEYSRMLTDAATDQDKVMILIDREKGKISMAEMARRIGWVNPTGVPNKSRVNRIVASLKSAKLLLSKRDGGLQLTAAGKKEVSAKKKANFLDETEEFDAE